jgi:parvulin-like peptidyl-prolyl isomerase
VLKNISKKRLLTAGGIVLLIIAIITSFGFWLYSSPIGPAKIKIFRQLNLPVAQAGSGLIGGGELFSRYEIAIKLYGNDKSFQATKAQADILDRLIEIKKLENIAGSRNIGVSNEEVAAEYNRIAAEEGGADKFEKMLNSQYYFTPEQFREKSLRPDVLKTKLAISFYNDKGLNPNLYKTLATVSAQLAQGTSFSDLAKTYSEDLATSNFGGDSGTIPNADLAPEFQTGLKDIQPGQTTIIATRFGIYIVKVVNRMDDNVTGGSVHFQSILLNYGKIDSKATESAFTKWYNAQAKNIKVKKFINL